VTLYVRSQCGSCRQPRPAYPAHRHSNQDDAAGGHSVDPYSSRSWHSGIEFASALTAAATVELVEHRTVAATGLPRTSPPGSAVRGGFAVPAASDMTQAPAQPVTDTGGPTEARSRQSRHGNTRICRSGRPPTSGNGPSAREFAVPVSHFLRIRVTTSVHHRCVLLDIVGRVVDQGRWVCGRGS